MLNITIASILGTPAVSTHADLGRTMHAATIGINAIDVTNEGISKLIISKCKTAIKGLGDIPASDRKAALTKAMKDIHAKAFAAWMAKDDITLASVMDVEGKDVPLFAFPTPRTEKGERKKGTQIMGSWFSLNAPELDEQPTVDLIVPGGAWKSKVSDMGKLWKLTDSETVQKVIASSDKKVPEQGLRDALTTATGNIKNDRTELYKVFAGAIQGFDLTGSTLNSSQLLELEASLVSVFETKLGLVKVA